MRRIPTIVGQSLFYRYPGDSGDKVVVLEVNRTMNRPNGHGMIPCVKVRIVDGKGWKKDLEFDCSPRYLSAS